MSIRTIRTPKNRKAVLTAIEDGKSIAAACRAARIGRTSLHEWRHDEPEFDAEFEEAVEIGNDAIRDEVQRRAFEGSDTMLIFLAKARCPEFRDRQAVEHTGKDGAPITVVYKRDSEPAKTSDG
jgi:hypothetical protein